MIKVENLKEGDNISITGFRRTNCTVTSVEKKPTHFKVNVSMHFLSRKQKEDGMSRNTHIIVPFARKFCLAK